MYLLIEIILFIVEYFTWDFFAVCSFPVPLYDFFAYDFDMNFEWWKLWDKSCTDMFYAWCETLHVSTIYTKHMNKINWNLFQRFVFKTLPVVWCHQRKFSYKSSTWICAPDDNQEDASWVPTYLVVARRIGHTFERQLYEANKMNQENGMNILVNI